MSDLVIGNYTAAVTIDGSTHYLLIQPGGSSTAYKKITRNVYLGVSGQPADISTSQNFTNKVLDNTNTLTVKDSLFTLQDNLDTTKQAQFQLSGITTATTRTYTLPNASSTLADIATSQTFTNKTLTAPVITGGSIDNTTITVDAIAGHTIAGNGTVYGLAINSGVLQTSNSVKTTNIIDANVTNTKLQNTGTFNSSWAWTSFVPSWTNLTPGSGTVTAKYTQVGKIVYVHITFTYGVGSAVGTAPVLTLPVTAAAYGGTSSGRTTIGQIHCEDNGVAGYDGIATLLSTTTAALNLLNTSSTYASQSSVTATVPFTWGNGDELMIALYYEAA